VVRFVFSVEDLARTRFAISPMLELVHSLVALRDPAHAALHLPWLRSLSGRLDGLALERAVALLPPRGFTPDFLTPPPSGPLGSIEDDLAALRATRVAQIRDEIELFAFQHPKAEATAARWLAHPRHEVRRLADLLAAYWERAVEPVWPRVRAFLDADVAHRSRRLADGGPAALFADLADGVTGATATSTSSEGLGGHALGRGPARGEGGADRLHEGGGSAEVEVGVLRDACRLEDREAEPSRDVVIPSGCIYQAAGWLHVKRWRPPRPGSAP
jgi:hypothetical protein